MTHPQIKKIKDNELEMLNKAKKEIYPFEGFAIQTYTWGNPADKKILLIHGWEGHAGNFVDLIEALVEKNYCVISFDGPSHGFSSKGSTSLFAFSELIGEVIQKYGCKKLVSHSFGGVATSYALYNNRHIKIEKYVLFTTPDKFMERINFIVKHVGVTEKVKNMLIKKVEDKMKIEVKTFNVSRFVQETSVEKSMIIHDINDKVIPISQSRNVCKNWGVCEFMEIEGTGHLRMLRTPEVIEKAVTFLNA